MTTGRKYIRTLLAGLLVFSGAFVAVLVGGATSASATSSTLYVSTTGTGDCTSLANACSAISGAVSVATSGAYAGEDVTIDVAAGTYMENDSLSVSSLSSLTIAGAGASSTFVNGGGLSSVITVSSGTVIISGLTVENGYVPASAGGGILNFGTTTVTNSVITGNTAGNGAQGAGLYNGGTLTVSDSTVSGNTGGAGAGIYNSSGQLTVSDSSISGNTTSLNGGGVSNDSAGATATITDSTFSGNSAAVGGALYVGREPVTLAASTIVGNSATAGDGGGIANFSTLDMAGDVMADNGQGVDCGSIGSAVTDLGYNIDDDGSCGFSASGSISNSSSLDVSLAPLANNGGPTQTILPTGGSPAAGAIPNPTTVDAIQLCPTTDQRGTASALNAACNIGAVQGTGQLTPSTPVISNLPASGFIGTGFTATVSTTGDGTESVTSSTTAVCTASGLAVSFVGLGTCTLTAHVAAGPNYAAADGTGQDVPIIDEAPTITSASATTFVVGAHGTFTVKATGYPTTMHFTESGTLPGGIALSSAGVLSGTPTATGLFAFTITASNGVLPNATQSFEVAVVGPPTITGISPSSGPPSTVVRITGTNLEVLPLSDLTVELNGTLVALDSVGRTAITVKVPTGATSGYITVTTPGGSATSTTKFTVLGPPVITGFTPSSGTPGTVVTITGTNLLYSGVPTQVEFHGTLGTITSNTSTKITVKVPWDATTGDITVATNLGIATSATKFTVPGPVITGFTPSSGTPGTVVTITGTYLSEPVASRPTNVTFNGLAGTITTNTSAKITVKVPTGATTGDITVTTPSGSATSATKFTVIGPPTITGFSPSSGPPGTVVRITGTNLDFPPGEVSVRFNGTLGTVTLFSRTSIGLKVPTGATTGYITVTTPGGSATSTTKFTVLGPPTITGFTPSSGLPGTVVTITGTNLLYSGVPTIVRFDDIAGTVITDTSTKLTVKVPTGAKTGDITVATYLGIATSTTKFTVLGPPTITGFTPPSGPPGTVVTITGTNLEGATSVTFGGKAGTVTSDTSTKITVTVPADARSGDITVSTSVGRTTSAPKGFTVTGPPTITGFTPPSGPPGTVVTITGTDLLQANVTFNGLAGTVTSDTSTKITVKVPTGAATGYITVTTSLGSAISATKFTAVSVPTITGFTPTSGPPGRVVTINGTDLSGATEVTFNGVAGTVITDTSTKITVKVPTGAATGYITVTTPSGSVTSATKFIYTGPTITGFTPSSGTPGTVVTITGGYLLGATKVTFDGVAGIVTSDTNPKITVKVPLGTANGYITVTTPSGSATSVTEFTVLGLPTITGFTPSSGPPGTVVTITGTKLLSARDDPTKVAFNGVAGTVITNTATTITVKVPTGAATGYITVSTSNGPATSATEFTVPGPTITGFTPSSGPSGTSVVITGTNFEGPKSVTFNGKAGRVTNDTSTKLTVTVPTGATTGRLTVTTAAGTATSASNFTVLT